jgi:hypothetical protein
MSQQQAARVITARHRRRRRGTGDVAGRTGGAEGNERLTAMTGAVLLVLFAAEGITIASVHKLLTLHFFVGMLVAGPVLLKIGSTGYRFVRYYSGAVPYVRKGPPAPLLRLLGPVVVLTSCGVIGSGVALAFAGPGAGPWLVVHKALFVLWFGAMTIHVLAYAPRLARLAWHVAAGDGQRAVEGGHGHASAGGHGHAAAGSHGRAVASGNDSGPATVEGSATRWLLLAAALAVGLILAVLTLQLTGPWQVSGAAAIMLPVARPAIGEAAALLS